MPPLYFQVKIGVAPLKSFNKLMALNRATIESLGKNPTRRESSLPSGSRKIRVGIA
jgi:hypothetical protein